MSKINWKDWRILGIVIVALVMLSLWLKYELVDRPKKREQWSREFDLKKERRATLLKSYQREIVLKLRTCVVNLKESKSDIDAYSELKKMTKLIDRYNDEIDYGTIAITSGFKYHLDGAKNYKVDCKLVISEFQDMANEIEARFSF